MAPSRLPILLAVAAAASLLPIALAQGVCRGATSSRFDSFCNQVCNHEPPYCPSEFCVCDGASPTPSPATGGAGQECRALVGNVGDDWCNLVCNSNPSFCPAAYCSCSPAGADTDADILDINSFWQEFSAGNTGEIECCAEGRRGLFYTETDSLYKYYLDTDTVELCAELGGDPNEIVIDEDGDVWVTSRVSNVLWRVPFDCSDKFVVTTFPDTQLAVGAAIAFAGGRIYVSGSTGIIEVTVDENKELVSWENTGWTVQEVGTMASYAGCIYFTEFNKDVYKVCPSVSQVPTLFIQGNEYGFPDVQGISVTSCGVYVSVTDSNQVWVCEGVDEDEATSCTRYCELENIDTDTCFNLQNPWGLTLGCCCDLYVVSRDSGEIVRYDGLSNVTFKQGDVLIDDLFHPKGIAFFAQGPPCSVPPVCNSALPTPSETPTTTPSSSATTSQSASSLPTLSSTPSMSASPSPTTSPTQSASVTPSTSATASPPPVPVVSYCLTSDNTCGEALQSDFVQTGDGLTLTITSDSAISVSSAVCGGASFAVSSSDGGLTFVGTVDPFTVGANEGQVINCTIDASETSGLGRALTVSADPSCSVTGDDTPPDATCSVDFGPGVSLCLGVRETAEVTVSSATSGQTITELTCNGQPVDQALGSTTNQFLVNNTVAPLTNFSCSATVRDSACNTQTVTCEISTCPPVGRLVGDVQRPNQSGSSNSAFSVGVVSTQLLECVDLEPNVKPTRFNCRTFPEEVNRTFDIPTVFLKLLLGGDTLTAIDPTGVSPVIRLNQLVPNSDPVMCFVYSDPIFNDAANSKTTACKGADLARCLDTVVVDEICTSNLRAASLENDILPRIRESFADQTEAGLILTPDIIAITATLCPTSAKTEYSISYAHYQFGSNSILQTADKPSLAPRPTYVDENGVTRAPAICVDVRDHPAINNMMNSTKGSIICLDDPELVISDTSQVAGFKPPPGETVVVGDITPIAATGDNKDTKVCPFRAVEGGSNPSRYCGDPTQRNCVQFTQP